MLIPVSLEISTMLFTPSILEMTSHSRVEREIFRLSARSISLKVGMDSMEPIFLRSSFHSSILRAASINNEVTERVMVVLTLKSPSSKTR